MGMEEIRVIKSMVNGSERRGKLSNCTYYTFLLYCHLTHSCGSALTIIIFKKENKLLEKDFEFSGMSRFRLIGFLCRILHILKVLLISWHALNRIHTRKKDRNNPSKTNS